MECSFAMQIDTKRYHDIIEYYYSWKKYCNDEYRGRNRHHSEDVSALGCVPAWQETVHHSTIFCSPLSSSFSLPSPSPSSSSLLSHPPPSLLFSQILADDDYPHANSDTSSSGSADNEPLPPHLLELRKGEKRHLTPQPLSSLSNSIPPLSSQYSTYDHLPIVYAPHTSNPKQTVHQYKCKYPGCNQVCLSLTIMVCTRITPVVGLLLVISRDFL